MSETEQVLSKTCKKCLKVKPLDDFHIDNKNKDKRKNICKECRNSKVKNSHYNFDKNLSNSIYKSLKSGKETALWVKIVGFTLQDLRDHLESLFDSDMSWNNYGTFWVLDKIIPSSYYNYSNNYTQEIKKCWNIKNFRPVRKSDKKKKSREQVYNLVSEYNLYDILPIGNLKVKFKDLSIQTDLSAELKIQ